MACTVYQESLLRRRGGGWYNSKNNLFRGWNKTGYSRCWDQSTQWVVPQTAAASYGKLLVSFWPYCSLHYLPILFLSITPSLSLFSSPQLQQSHVDSYMYWPNQPIPCCQLQLQWTKTEVPHGTLSHHLKLIGANPPETYIEVFRNVPCLGRTAAPLDRRLCILCLCVCIGKYMYTIWVRCLSFLLVIRVHLTQYYGCFERC